MPLHEYIPFVNLGLILLTLYIVIRHTRHHNSHKDHNPDKTSDE